MEDLENSGNVNKILDQTSEIQSLSVQAIRVLGAHGANTLSHDKSGSMLLDLATKARRHKNVQILSAICANPSTCDNKHKSVKIENGINVSQQPIKRKGGAFGKRRRKKKPQWTLSRSLKLENCGR